MKNTLSHERRELVTDLFTSVAANCASKILQVGVEKVWLDFAA